MCESFEMINSSVNSIKMMISRKHSSSFVMITLYYWRKLKIYSRESDPKSADLLDPGVPNIVKMLSPQVRTLRCRPP